MTDSFERVRRGAIFASKKKKRRKRGQEVRKIADKRKVRKINVFYDSREWKELRYAALKRYGAKCGLCGVTRADGAVLNVDHIKPRSKFPELALDIENLQILCAWCNQGKGAHDMTDWRAY